MSPVGHVPSAQESDEIQNKQQKSDNPDSFHYDRRFFKKQRLSEYPYELRKYEIDYWKNRRAKKIEQKHSDIRFVIGYKFLDKIHGA